MAFEINLIRQSVLTPGKRRAVFLGMTFYLVFCCLVLSLLCYRAFTDLTDVRELKLKAPLPITHERGKNVSAENILQKKNEIAACIGVLEKIDQVLSSRVDISQLLSSLSAHLPQGGYVDNFKIDNSKSRLDFNIVFPASSSGSFNQGDFISDINSDAALMSVIRNIDSSTVTRQEMDGLEIVVLKFSCSLINKRQP